MFLKADSFWNWTPLDSPQKTLVFPLVFCLFPPIKLSLFWLKSQTKPQCLPQDFSNPDIFYLFVYIKMSLPKEKNKLKLGSVWYFLTIIFDGGTHDKR